MVRDTDNTSVLKVYSRLIAINRENAGRLSFMAEDGNRGAGPEG